MCTMYIVIHIFKVTVLVYFLLDSGGGKGSYKALAASPQPQGDDSSPPPLCGLIFFEGDRCLCLTLKFVERLKCYSAKPNESCIIFGIYYFISCLISIVILSLCIFFILIVISAKI